MFASSTLYSSVWVCFPVCWQCDMRYDGGVLCARDPSPAFFSLWCKGFIQHVLTTHSDVAVSFCRAILQHDDLFLLTAAKDSGVVVRTDRDAYRRADCGK